ncbi:hypothetical protein A3G16_02220 [Candidatus Curtissbacteria bacterium RIFCSPLOWO2_12_FULL_41_16]|nr:MAG: hypothetical protein A3G16_02220 [Candidatus Curtissbacteria bacterium RIFCSPLOWO2_12_FULL_41_16]
MVKKLKVAVLMGGKSPEHQISLLTGREIAKNLSPKKYDPLSIIISRNGKSFRLNNKEYLLGQLSTVNCQLFIIAMHGPYGEDGTIQGFLDLIGVPYTGSGVLASALGMDKIYSRKLFTHKGLKVPKYLVLSKDEKQSKVWQHLLPPIFIKPNAQGSSIGASIVKKKKNLKKALNLAFSYGNTTIIEEFLDGIEVTCAILGNSNPKPLPLVEIIPKKEFFDYEAKYNEKLTDEITPARISKSLTKKAQCVALLAYQTLGCRGFGRVDMIIKGKGVYVLEVNTVPGLTPVSLFPKAAAAAGISYQKLLDKIINLAIEN